MGVESEKERVINIVDLTIKMRALLFFVHTIYRSITNVFLSIASPNTKEIKYTHMDQYIRVYIVSGLLRTLHGDSRLRRCSLPTRNLTISRQESLCLTLYIIQPTMRYNTLLILQVLYFLFLDFFISLTIVEIFVNYFRRRFLLEQYNKKCGKK